jgi:hypothetical protein
LPGWSHQVLRLLLRRLRDHRGALLHLGLNPKGKPGLWLVQKTH